jgi:hypothetical protein
LGVTEGTHFLNVDLDVESRRDLGPILSALGETVVVLYSGSEGRLHRVSLELFGFARYTTPETCIARFARLVKRLPTGAQRLWKGATLRRFDIGFQGGTAEATYTTRITANTLRRAAEIGAEIAITIYGPTIAKEIPMSRAVKDDT